MPEIKPLYIERPIEVKEVYDYLEVDKYLGTWDVGYICSNSHGKINMWSRKKPVRQATKTPYPQGTNPAWWRGYNGKCGLSFMLRSSYTDIRSAYTTDGKNGWSYEGVYRLGLFQDYARLMDFEGYMYNASAPYKGFACEDGEEVAKGYGTSFRLQPGFSILPPSGEEEDPNRNGPLTLSDISSGVTVQRPVAGAPAGTTEAVERLGDWYLGVVIYEGMTYKARVVGKSLGPVEVPAQALSFASIGDKLTAYPVLCPVSQGWLEADMNTFYLPVPGVQPVSFKIVNKDTAAGFKVYLHAYYNYQGDEATGITIHYEVTQTGSGSVNLTNNTVWVRFGGNDVGDTLMNGERYYEQDDIHLTGSGQVAQGTFIHTISPQFRGKGYVIYLTLHSGAYKYQTWPLAHAETEL